MVRTPAVLSGGRHSSLGRGRTYVPAMLRSRVPQIKAMPCTSIKIIYRFQFLDCLSVDIRVHQTFHEIKLAISINLSDPSPTWVFE